MNYESPEDRIDRLENQVKGLTSIIGNIIAYLGKNHEAVLQTSMILGETDRKLLAADLFTLKSVFENSRGFDEPFRQEMLKMIAGQEKMIASLPKIEETLKQMAVPVLPEDLFGPGQQWPPQNPPDKPPGS